MICISMYLYIQRERERQRETERDRERDSTLIPGVSVYMYACTLPHCQNTQLYHVHIHIENARTP